MSIIKSTKPIELSETEGWELKPKDKYRASNLALQIMSFRREYGSEGATEFLHDWLLPTIAGIVQGLVSKGYKVQIDHTKHENGEIDFCYEVKHGDKVSKTLYVAHYDTVDNDTLYSTGGKFKRWDIKMQMWYEEVIEPSEELTRKAVSLKNGIAYLDMNDPTNDKVSCLGADDGAGLAVMLSLMAQGVVGGYCFTTGEECVGIGADVVKKTKADYLAKFTHAVEVDRRGYEEIIFAQGNGECASEKFTQWLCDKLGMGHYPSALGTYTDVATFAEVIPECVNIACGYINAHSVDEQVDLAYLDKLTEALAKVDWSIAPIVREANEFGTDYGDWYSRGYKYPTDVVSSAELGGDVLLEDTLQQLLLLFQSDLNFMVYVLEENVITEDDLAQCLFDWYGTPYLSDVIDTVL